MLRGTGFWVAGAGYWVLGTGNRGLAEWKKSECRMMNFEVYCTSTHPRMSSRSRFGYRELRAVPWNPLRPDNLVSRPAKCVRIYFVQSSRYSDETSETAKTLGKWRCIRLRGMELELSIYIRSRHAWQKRTINYDLTPIR